MNSETFRATARIALTLFVIEAGIMVALIALELAFPSLKGNVVLEPVLDATALVLLASPAIYYWIVRPYFDLQRMRAQLLVLLSHELRTPLNGTIGMLEVIRETTDDPDARNNSRVALQSASDLSQKIDAILNLSLLEEGTFATDRATVDLGAMLHDLSESHAACARAKGLSWILACEDLDGILVEIDRAILSLGLKLILDNAVRETRSGAISLTAGLSDRANGPVLRVAVCDDGPGIAKKELDRIFDLFYRVDMGYDRQSNGLGLGLPLVKKLVDSVSGDIAIDSVVGHGTTVVLTLPVTPAGRIQTLA
jgi:signal transduction histidine kinase